MTTHLLRTAASAIAGLTATGLVFTVDRTYAVFFAVYAVACGLLIAGAALRERRVPAEHDLVGAEIRGRVRRLRGERGETHPALVLILAGMLACALGLVALMYWAYGTRSLDNLILVLAALFLAGGLLVAVGAGVRSVKGRRDRPRVHLLDPRSSTRLDWHPKGDLWAGLSAHEIHQRIKDTKDAIDRRARNSATSTARRRRGGRGDGMLVIAVDEHAEQQAKRRRGDRGSIEVEMLLLPVVALVFALILLAVLRWAYFTHGLGVAAAIVGGLLLAVGLPAGRTAVADRAQRRRDERGSQTLQLAILVPGILLLVFTIFQASMYYWAKSVASAAARQGAAAVSREDATSSDGSARAREFLDSPSGDVLRGAEISVDQDATEVSVTVEGSAIGPIPGLWHVSQTSTMPLEEFTTDEGVAD